jgi:hypothetical protein
MVYASGTFTSIGGLPQTYVAGIREERGITQVSPNRGGDLGSVTVVITGFGFPVGATAKLVRPGEASILGSQVVITADGSSISALFDLAGRAQGAWDVVVTNPDMTFASLPAGFTIEPGLPQQIRVDVVGPALIRPSRSKAFDIVLENLGNSDVVTMPLWITRIPSDATVALDFPLAHPPQGGGEPDWSQAPLTFTGPGGRYLPLVIPRLPPGATVRRLTLTVPNSVTNMTIDAALTPPWADGEAFRSCLFGAGVVQAPACMGTQLTALNASMTATPGLAALSGIGVWAKIAWQCEGAASLPAALAEAEQVLDLMLQPVEQGGAPGGCELDLVPRWQDRLGIGVVTSVDPNDKLGADGHGTNRQIGADQILPYSIRFENLETATAPAQEVTVIDALDGATIDLNTVSVGRITFGNRSIMPPPGLASYTTTVDLRPQHDLLVRVAAHLDRATGVLGWSLTSLDPVTGQPPEDPLEGFLPPNVVPPQGEGSVLFTARPRTPLAGGTAIRNSATIYFDGVPLQTPEWSNTVDATPPASNVLPLGANQDSASFTVHWQASGSPPDLRDYSVYVSENGGAFRPWRVHTTATADTIIAPGGRTYAFYSLARDSSGNLEAVPSTPDVQTYSRAAVGDDGAVALALEGTRPNPARGRVRVWFTLPSTERAVLDVIDVAGRRVARREVGALGPGRHSVDLSPSVRRPGLYFLRLAQGDRVLHARMAVIR